MRLLLDTHIFLWWDRDLARLRPEVEAAISDRANGIVVSSITGFELALKRACGQLEFKSSIETLVRGYGFELLSFSFPHAEEAAALPLLHRDPFDRMLIAQARLEQLTLVTDDEQIRRYSVTVL